jgi:hypothetical protein
MPDSNDSRANRSRIVAARRRRYPPGCPDADWCAGNNLCYWNCEGRRDVDETDA